MNIALPRDLAGRPAEVVVRPLTADGPGEKVASQVQTSAVTFQADAHRPYRVSLA